MSQTSVQRVTNLELKSDENVARCSEFDASIAERVGDIAHFVEDGKAHPPDWANEIGYDDEFNEALMSVICDPKISEADVAFTPDVYDDTYLNTE